MEEFTERDFTEEDIEIHDDIVDRYDPDLAYDRACDDECMALGEEVQALVKKHAESGKVFFRGSEHKVWKTLMAYVPKEVFEERAQLFGYERRSKDGGKERDAE